MSNIIQIKRRGTGGAAGAPPSLKSGEISYNMADGYFYVGYGDDGGGNATSIKAFARDDFNISRLIPAGGTSGQVLKKNSATNYDLIWGNDLGTIYTNGTGLTLTSNTFAVDFSLVAPLASPPFTGAPTAPTPAAGDASTKIATTSFVSTAILNAQQGMSPKTIVKAATTANIALTAPGAAIDGVTLVSGDRILVKNQTTPSQNGVYIWNGAAVTATRATDAETWAELVGAYMWVEQGTVNGDTAYYNTADRTGTIETTAITFVQFANAVQLVAGNGIVRNGNTFDVQGRFGVTASADFVELTGQALALHNLATNGSVTRTGADTFAARTSVGTANRLTVVNGDGVAGNPTFDIASNYAGQSTITTLGTISAGIWNGTTIAIANGGTGATTSSAARTALGVAIGTDVQAYNANLAAIGGLTYAADRISYATGVNTFATQPLTAFARTLLDDADAATARGTLGVVIGTDVQAYNGNLASIAGNTVAANQILYSTGPGAFTTTAFTAFGRSLVDDTDAPTARATLGLTIGTDVQAQSANLTALAGLTGAANKGFYFTGTGALSLYDLSAFGRSLVDDADATAGRVTLGLGTLATQNANAVAITGGTIDNIILDGGTF